MLDLYHRGEVQISEARSRLGTPVISFQRKDNLVETVVALELM